MLSVIGKEPASNRPRAQAVHDEPVPIRPQAMMRAIAAGACAITVGAGVLYAGTDGLRAFTTEGARRLSVARAPVAAPSVALQDADGRDFMLGALRGRPIIVTFMYTRCTTYCGVQGARVQRLYRAQLAPPEGERAWLVSVTFDGARDTPDALCTYGDHLGADGVVWRFARVKDERELSELLRVFGIVVIPDSLGEFQHSAALHIVDRAGRLARILDVEASPYDVALAIQSAGGRVP